MLGVILVNKPKGITSHDVVYRARKALGTKRIGHAGTLDPIATGLLVLAVGPATRFLQYLPLEPKEYDCTFLFGKATNTYDAEGELTVEEALPDDLGTAIESGLQQFQGLIDQAPPVFSAIKKAGKPLYAYARKGEDVEVEPRRVFVQTFELLAVDPPHADFRIVCSGGTYVRSLAHDLGQALGCGAHVTELQRTRVGRFDVDESVELSELSASDLIPLAEALVPMPMVHLNAGQLERVRNGQWVKAPSETPTHHAALLDLEGRVVSVARVEGNLLHPQCVLPPEALNGSL